MIYKPYDEVPGCPNFVWWEGFSAGYRSGKRVYRIDPIPYHLANNAHKVFQNLQIIRTHFNRSLMITYVGCLYRTYSYNLAAGGSYSSRHKFALAVDCYIPGITPWEIYEFAITRGNTEFRGCGIISDKSIHLDIRRNYWFAVYQGVTPRKEIHD